MVRAIVLSIFLFITFAVQAQNFRLGFQASPHLSWMSSSKADIVNNSVLPGVKYGLEADLFLAGYPRYSLNTGMYITNMRLEANYSIDEPFFINESTFNQAVDLKFKLNYLEIPVNIKLRSDQFYRLTFYGQFGLTNLINLSASAASSDNQFSGDNVNDGFGNRSIKLYNLSMLMGGGMEYDVGGNTALNFGIQYSNGLTDFTAIRGLEEKSIFNSIRLMIGIMF